MRKRETKRVGLQEWQIETASGEDVPPALKEMFADLRAAPPEIEAEARSREHIAIQRMNYWRRRIKDKSDLDETERRVADFFEWAESNEYKEFPPRDGFPEGTYDHLLAEWLSDFRQYRKSFDSGDLQRAADKAFRLGRLTEVFGWRFGQDQDTGKRREELALGKKEQHKSLPKARAKRKQSTLVYPDWWDDAQKLADEIWARYPSYSKKRVAEMVYTQLEQPDPPKPNTIRKRISKR